MSNYVNKLMDIVGIKPFLLPYYETTEEALIKKIKTIYRPVFERQKGELLKLIASKKNVDIVSVNKARGNYKFHCSLYNYSLKDFITAKDKDFDTALIKLVILLLKKEILEKAEVKKILEE